MTIRTQTRSPGTVVSDDSVGTLPWSDPEGAESEGGDAANATGPGTTEYLKATAYGFDLLSTATPASITFPVRRQNGAATTAPSVDAVGSIGQGSGAPGGTSASATLNAPAGTSNGDLLFALVTATGQGNVQFTTVPNGWTLVESYVVGASVAQAVYTKIADSDGDSGSWGITTSGGDGQPSIRGRIIRIADHAASSPIDVFSARNVTDGTSHQANEVTTTVDNCLVLSIFLSYGGASFSTPTGTTEHADQNSMAVFSSVQADAGATGDKASTSSGSLIVMALQIAIKPETQDVTDDAARLVVGGVVQETDYSSETPWASAYQSDSIGPIDISSLDYTDVNGSTFGLALSCVVEGAAEADVDHAPAVVTYDIDVDVDITSPEDEGTLDRPNATIEWEATVGGSAIAQASYRVRLYRVSDDVLLYDSGTVATSTQSHEIGSGTPTTPWATPVDSLDVRIQVDVTEDGTADPDGVGDAITGSAEIEVTTDWTPPTAPTGLAVEFVTVEEGS